MHWCHTIFATGLIFTFPFSGGSDGVTMPLIVAQMMLSRLSIGIAYCVFLRNILLLFTNSHVPEKVCYRGVYR